jgi:phenylacetate-coenzyme A ligase PaaK-like adenylate-forming protein
MGKECPHGRMHLFVDGSIVEAVDAGGRPVRPGERSEKILVTNLYNFTQPTIRYEMQDSVIPRDEPCPCGSPLPVVELIGREDDTFYCEAPDGAYLAFPPMSMESLMLELKGYRMFQIRQVERNRIRITFVPAQEEDPEGVRRRIQEHTSAYFTRHGLGGAISVDVEAVAEVERMQVSQKSKQIATLVGPPPDLERRLAFR